MTDEAAGFGGFERRLAIGSDFCDFAQGPPIGEDLRTEQGPPARRIAIRIDDGLDVIEADESPEVGHQWSCLSSSTMLPNTSVEQIKRNVLRHIIRDADILRGVYPNVLMEGFGNWWRHQTPGNYDCSVCVLDLHRFLSHSWQSSPMVKVLALFFFFNGHAAVCLATLVSGMCWLVQIWGCLPTWSDGCRNDFHNALVPGGPASIPFSAWSLVAFHVTYVMVLLQWQSAVRCFHKLAAAVGWRSAATNACFMDKLCIHQVDALKKKQGIDSLGGFLLAAEKFTILWDPTYFQRLWCVFELAFFVRLCPDGQLEFVPIAMHASALSFALASQLLMVCTFAFATHFEMTHLFVEMFVSQVPAVEELPVVACFIAVSPLCVLTYTMLTITFRRYQRARRMLKHQLATFSVDHAKCAGEKDRAFITDVITTIYGSVDSFNDFVQKDLNDHIERKYPSKSSDMSFEQSQHVGMALLAYAVLDASSFLRDADPAYLRGWLIGFACFSILGIPMMIKIMCVAARLVCLETRSSLQEFAVCLAIAVCQTLFVVAPVLLGLRVICSSSVVSQLGCGLVSTIVLLVCNRQRLSLRCQGDAGSVEEAVTPALGTVSISSL